MENISRTTGERSVYLRGFKENLLKSNPFEIKHETDCVFFCPAVKGLQKRKHSNIFAGNVKYKDERLSIKMSKSTLIVSKHPCSSARTVIMSSMHPVETMNYSNALQKKIDIIMWCEYINSACLR